MTQGLTGQLEQDYNSENEPRHPQMHSLGQFRANHAYVNHEHKPPFPASRARDLLPSILSRSPPGRSSTLPPIQRRDKAGRPRRSSITQNNRRLKHERTKSKEHARRLSIEGRKAFSAEPQGVASVMNKRWEDLIEAATSANEADSDRDLTPVRSLFSPCDFPPSLIAIDASFPVIHQTFFVAPICVCCGPLRDV